MKVLRFLNNEDADDRTRLVFEEIQKSNGKLPKIYRFIGNSYNALKSYLDFSEAQKVGSFSLREREAIILAVSEENGCSYCLSAHTEIAKNIGFRDEDIIRLRAGTYPDKRLNTLTNVAKSIIKQKGNIEETLVSVFFEAGYNEKALVDLIALVVEITFVNYIGRLTKPELDFPAARSLKEEVLT